MTTLDIAAAFRTDIGNTRSANEDSGIAEFPLFLVADGMGGYEAGDRASAAVIAAFRDVLGVGGPAELELVHRAFAEANARVAQVAATTTRGTGSTVTGCVAVHHQGEHYWLVLNVGDSRVYRLFSGELQQLTVDHSFAQELVDQHLLKPGDRNRFAERNVITRAIGAPDARPDTWLMPVTNGERLLVCSDGLHGELSEEELHTLLFSTGQPEQATTNLITAAKRAGGRDNISAIVLDVRSGGTDGHHDSDLTDSAFSLTVTDEDTLIT